MPSEEKRKLIDNLNAEISIRRQCDLLGLNRSSYYYDGLPEVSQEDEALMKVIDEIYTERPYYGRPRITNELKKHYGYLINHKRVYRLMSIMGIEAVFPKRDLSKPHPTHLIYPYLLKDLAIISPNQVWGVDITYVRMRRGWIYLFAIMDWHSRYILSWQLSDSLHVSFCCEALQRALTIGVPDFHNSDQGSHFTSGEYTGILQLYPSIKISMDHRGRCFDNIFTERLWRTIKYEEVYLQEYESIREARHSLAKYIAFYNTRRYHQSLGYRTPEDVYFDKSIVQIN